MNAYLRYLLIAVMAWLPVGQVLATCCMPQVAVAEVDAPAAEHPCDSHESMAQMSVESDDEAEPCQCGCSLIGHTSIVFGMLTLQAYEPLAQRPSGLRAEPLPAHVFPLLRPPTTAS